MYSKRHYPSKILLTGEYTVLLGYPAIAIPWQGRYAKWNDIGSEVDSTLLRFYQFIKGNVELKNHFLLNEFYAYIQNNGRLESSIPFGYGLGSSGSLCAAVLDRFTKINKKESELVYTLLKKMEDFFHGQSSGLDPMVSFYNCAVQICKGVVTFPNIINKDILQKYQLHLVDSKINRNTQDLVSKFKESIKDANYLSKVIEKIVLLNNQLMEALLNDNGQLFEDNWRELSEESLEIYQDMIPEKFRNFWNEGIQSESYYCKLCGAGGGGLFLTKVVDDKMFLEKLRIHNFEKFN